MTSSGAMGCNRQEDSHSTNRLQGRVRCQANYRHKRWWVGDLRAPAFREQVRARPAFYATVRWLALSHVLSRRSSYHPGHGSRLFPRNFWTLWTSWMSSDPAVQHLAQDGRRAGGSGTLHRISRTCTYTRFDSARNQPPRPCDRAKPACYGMAKARSGSQRLRREGHGRGVTMVAAAADHIH